MRLPGFTAEASLYRGINLYQMSGVSIHKEEGLYPAYRDLFLADVDEEGKRPYDPYDPENIAAGVGTGLALILFRGLGSVLVSLFSGGGGPSCVNPPSCRSTGDCCRHFYCLNNRCVRRDNPAYPCSKQLADRIGMPYVPCRQDQRCCGWDCVGLGEGCP